MTVTDVPESRLVKVIVLPGKVTICLTGLPASSIHVVMISIAIDVAEDREGALVGDDDVILTRMDLSDRLARGCRWRDRECEEHGRQEQKLSLHGYSFPRCRHGDRACTWTDHDNSASSIYASRIPPPSLEIEGDARSPTRPRTSMAPRDLTAGIPLMTASLGDGTMAASPSAVQRGRQRRRRRGERGPSGSHSRRPVLTMLLVAVTAALFARTARSVRTPSRTCSPSWRWRATRWSAG